MAGRSEPDDRPCGGFRLSAFGFTLVRAVNIKIQFFSYLRDLTGVSELEQTVAEGCTLGELHDQLCAGNPQLQEMSRATLLAVGVDYQPRTHVLREGDVVSFFPPVQGG